MAANQPYQPKGMFCRTQANPAAGLLYGDNQNVDPSCDERGILYVQAVPPAGSLGLGPDTFAAYADVEAHVAQPNPGLLTVNGFNDSAITVYMLFIDGNAPGTAARQSFRVPAGGAFSWTPTYQVYFIDLYIVASTTPDTYTPAPTGTKFWVRAEYIA